MYLNLEKEVSTIIKKEYTNTLYIYIYKMYAHKIPLPRPTPFNGFRVTQQTIGQQIPAGF